MAPPGMAGARVPCTQAGRHRPTFGPWPAAVPVANRGPKSRIFILLWRAYLQQRTTHTLDSWIASAPNNFYQAIQHATTACVQHVLLVQRPAARARAHSRRSLRNARSRIFLKLWKEHLRIKRDACIEHKQQSRYGKIAAHTRNAAVAATVNHRETSRINSTIGPLIYYLQSRIYCYTIGSTPRPRHQRRTHRQTQRVGARSTTDR